MTLALRPEGIRLGDGEPTGSNRLRGTIEDINFLGLDRPDPAASRRWRRAADSRHDRSTLDTFNEPHLTLPDGRLETVTVSFPAEACFVLEGSENVITARAATSAPAPRCDPEPTASRLAGIGLVILDKDGTLIDFHAMWSRLGARSRGRTWRRRPGGSIA